MNKIHILGIPMDLGQSRRGVDMGPSALRYAGLQKTLHALGYEVIDSGNTLTPTPEQAIAAPGLNRLHVVADVCRNIYTWGIEQPQAITLYLGGDHSISIGSVKAAAVRYPQLGVIWVDAHADFNTPATSPSGNIHGMPLAVLTGDGPEELTAIGGGVCLHPAQVVQIGIRDVDLDEKRRLLASGIHVYTMREIDERGMGYVARATLERLARCTHFHVSLDLDSLDPSEASGVGTPVQGGLSYREAHLLMEILSETGKVCSLDVVEVNPILDSRNRTAELAVDLLASLLGKQIL
jgi:arginase